MRYRKQLMMISVATLFLAGLGLFFGLADQVGLCINDGTYYDTGCMTRYSENIGGPLMYLAGSIFLSAIFLLFSSEQTYKKWRRFALWAIPIGIIILYLAPANGGSSMGTGKDISKETMSWFTSFVFLVTSLIIILKSYFANRKN